jgi:hypothetical protein
VALPGKGIKDFLLFQMFCMQHCLWLMSWVGLAYRQWENCNSHNIWISMNILQLTCSTCSSGAWVLWCDTLSCLPPLGLQITKCSISTNIVVTVLVATYLLSGSHLCNFSYMGVSEVNKNICCTGNHVYYCKNWPHSSVVVSHVDNTHKFQYVKKRKAAMCKNRT